MCGIFFSLATNDFVHPSQTLSSILRRRGPDGGGTLARKTIAGLDSDMYLIFHSTVLALRGRSITQQPFSHSPEDPVLGWNGEAWSIGGKEIQGNDTEAVYHGLVEVSTQKSNSDTDLGHLAILNYLSTIEGPFAFIFYDPGSNTLYFGRDALGRRSLMMRKESDCFMLSSCSDTSHEEGWTEMEPSGVYCLDLQRTSPSAPPAAGLPDISLYPWTQCFARSELLTEYQTGQIIPPLNSDISTDRGQSIFDEGNMAELKSRLLDSLRLRLQGIRDTTCPAQAQDSRHEERVAVLFSGGLDCTVLARLADDLLPSDQPIALLNVAFENPRLKNPEGPPEASQCEACPDRKTARAALKELRTICPGRQWHFVAINVTYDEMLTHRNLIVKLMKPHDTEMDLSIAMALYFASRGTGVLESGASSKDYTTKARVLLSGLGADELFGGYVRHETAFNRGGYQALVNELQLDLGRIGTRNLGRDDRVTAHWAKEVRYPFLDETLVAWVVKLPIWQKCPFHLTRGNGMPPDTEHIEAGKHLLRRLAWRLGLEMAAKEKKRAIQFGSRSAKMFSSKTKGTEAISAS